MFLVPQTAPNRFWSFEDAPKCSQKRLIPPKGVAKMVPRPLRISQGTGVVQTRLEDTNLTEKVTPQVENSMALATYSPKKGQLTQQKELP